MSQDGEDGAVTHDSSRHREIKAHLKQVKYDYSDD